MSVKGHYTKCIPSFTPKYNSLSLLEQQQLQQPRSILNELQSQAEGKSFRHPLSSHMMGWTKKSIY